MSQLGSEVLVWSHKRGPEVGSSGSVVITPRLVSKSFPRGTARGSEVEMKRGLRSSQACDCRVKDASSARFGFLFWQGSG